MKILRCTAVLFASLPGLLAQTTIAARPYVRAVGQSTVSAKPDQVKIDLAVVTQAATAQDASTQNATTVAAVLAALQALLGGPNADIQTVSYSLNPNYSFPPNGGNPTLLGYTATNTMEVTTPDLTVIGKVIDSGIQAGANRVQSLQFSLKNPEPVRGQALALATAEAKAQANAMAGGLGMHTGAVLSIEETTSTPVVFQGLIASAASTTTPIVTGPVQVSASVTLTIELTP